MSEPAENRDSCRFLDVFDRIYVINLPHRADRRREMAEELDRLGIALDSPQVHLQAASRFDEPAGFPSPGARGCFDSHLNVLRDAAGEGYETILVLEDDVDFDRDLPRLKRVLAELAEQRWDMFYGGYLDWSAPSSTSAALVSTDPSETLLTSHFIGFRRSAITVAVPYLEQLASRPPGAAEGGPMHVDGAYNWFRRAHPHLRTLVAVPPLGHQRPSRTDIHALAIWDRHPLLRPISALLRRAKRRVKGQSARS